MPHGSHRLLHALIVVLLVACTRAAPAAEVTCAQTSSCSQACSTEKLAECVAGCAARIGKKGKPYWEALQACSKPACEKSCVEPASFTCRLCVMKSCAGEVAACLAN